MDVISLETVDSTSSHANRLLDQGREPPFAVWAREQTAGRGRRGHQWKSPQGNLYMTIALGGPPAGEDRAGCLPLKVGVLVARYIESAYRVRLTLKWPNDLLFAGRKLGGILCELSGNGRGVSRLSVGIGLNVAAPPEGEGLETPSVGLEEVVGAPVDLAGLAREFAAFFETGWQHLALEDVPAAFGEFAIPPGHLWIDSQGQSWLSRSIGSDGSFKLESAEGGKAHVLSSGDHGFRWGLSEPYRRKRPLWLADVGNSAVKVAFHQHAVDPQPSWRYEVFAADGTWREAARELTEKAKSTEGPKPIIHVGSVRPASLEAFRAALGADWIVTEIPKRPVYRWGGYPLAQLGVDRLALIEGWLAERRRDGGSRAGAHDAAILVSCGTATTWDVVTAAGEHWGGYIIPGLQTALESLNEKTGLLPKLKPETYGETGGSLPVSTQRAMQDGAALMTVSAIENTRAYVQSYGFRRVEVRLTGGNASFLAPAFDVSVDQDLLVSGLRSIVLGGEQR